MSMDDTSGYRERWSAAEIIIAVVCIISIAAIIFFSVSAKAESAGERRGTDAPKADIKAPVGAGTSPAPLPLAIPVKKLERIEPRAPAASEAASGAGTGFGVGDIEILQRSGPSAPAERKEGAVEGTVDYNREAMEFKERLSNKISIAGADCWNPVIKKDEKASCRVAVYPERGKFTAGSVSVIDWNGPTGETQEKFMDCLVKKLGAAMRSVSWPEWVEKAEMEPMEFGREEVEVPKGPVPVMAAFSSPTLKLRRELKGDRPAQFSIQGATPCDMFLEYLDEVADKRGARWVKVRPLKGVDRMDRTGFAQVGDVALLFKADLDLMDQDGDELPDSCDNCPLRKNKDQADADKNSMGDACEPKCGNNLLEEGEECDGLGLAALACSRDCKVNEGWSCRTISTNAFENELGPVPQNTTDCRPKYGDGILVSGEECDMGTNSPTSGCLDGRVQDGWTCVRLDPPAAPPASICKATLGDGKKVGSEKCDDGNHALGDGCYDSKIEPGWECREWPGRPSECKETAVSGIFKVRPALIAGVALGKYKTEVKNSVVRLPTGRRGTRSDISFGGGPLFVTGVSIDVENPFNVRYLCSRLEVDFNRALDGKAGGGYAVALAPAGLCWSQDRFAFGAEPELQYRRLGTNLVRYPDGTRTSWYDAFGGGLRAAVAYEWEWMRVGLAGDAVFAGKTKDSAIPARPTLQFVWTLAPSNRFLELFGAKAKSSP